MNEIIFYNSEGDSSDKQYSTSFAFLNSLHSSTQFSQYRQCYSNKNGSVMTGLGPGSKLITACKSKALIHVYLYGKESPEQKIPIPEELTVLQLIQHPNSSLGSGNDNWLLIGGGKSGRLFVWELDSGILICVKEAHYQSVAVIKYSKGLLCSGGLDSRVLVWKLNDLITSLNDETNAKPFATFTEHSLPITDLIFSKGLINDLKVFSVSKDATVRCHSLITKELITTFVSPFPIDSIAADPAFRVLYIGLSNGTIRSIPLYQVNPQNHVIEAVGGCGRIVTLKDDFELNETFIYHQLENDTDVEISQLKISFDGTKMISGDSKGRLFIADLSTKQISKKLKNLVGPISNILLFNVAANDSKLEKANNNDKTIVRNIPVLKRVVGEKNDLIKHEIQKKLTVDIADEQKSWLSSGDLDLTSFLEGVQNESRWFTDFSGVSSSVVGGGDATSVAFNHADQEENNKKIADLEEKLKKVTDNYNKLRTKHADLYKEHSKLLNN